MQIRIKGQTETYTLLTIVSETVVTKYGIIGNTFEIKAIAYVYDRDRAVKSFPASDIERVEK